MQYQYTVIVEQEAASFGAYVPDLPGCVAVAGSREEVLTLIREAIAFHLEDLKGKGKAIPQPHSYSELVEVAA